MSRASLGLRLGPALVTAAEPMATPGIGFQGQERERLARAGPGASVGGSGAQRPASFPRGGAVRAQETPPSQETGGSGRLSLTPHLCAPQVALPVSRVAPTSLCPGEWSHSGG